MLARTIALAILAILVSACGQKGPLYLPKDKPVPGAETAPASPPPVETEKK